MNLEESFQDCVKHHRYCRRWVVISRFMRLIVTGVGIGLILRYLSNESVVFLLAGLVQFAIAGLFQHQMVSWGKLADEWADEADHILFLLIVQHGYEVD